MKKIRRSGGVSENVSLFLRFENRSPEHRAAITQLRHCLVHTRELLNGRDFLFSGPPSRVRESLGIVAHAEQHSSGGLQCVFTRIDAYFLLRIQGPEERQGDIASYFET